MHCAMQSRMAGASTFLQGAGIAGDSCIARLMTKSADAARFAG